jgi:ABC-type Zn uptake system ZnuABC Zn-binding protein ZnuA
VLQVSNQKNNKDTAIKGNKGRFPDKAKVPVYEGKQNPHPQLHPKQAYRYSNTAVAAMSPEPEIAE